MLVRKKKKWRWEKVQEKAFGKLKKAFTIEPVLAILDLDKKNASRSRCVRLYNRRSVVNKV